MLLTKANLQNTHVYIEFTFSLVDVIIGDKDNFSHVCTYTCDRFL